MTGQPKSDQNHESHKLKGPTDGAANLEVSGPLLLEVIFSTCKNVVRSLCLKNLTQVKETAKLISFEHDCRSGDFLCLSSIQTNSSKVTQQPFISLFLK